METNKIVFDFTKKSPQNVAILPASLAQRMLKEYAKKLSKASASDIIEEHVNNLRQLHSVNEAVECSMEFVEERTLIANIVAEKWDAYEVK
jgi:hypothetical protein